MKNGWAIAGIVLAVVLVVLGGSAASIYNLGNKSETSIHARYAANENILAQYGQKIAEQVGVTEMARDDMAKLLGDSLEARYGSEGAKAQFSMIQEAFPGLDQGVYTSIQQSIEAGRNDFTLAQNQLADAKRVYQTSLGSLWTGSWLSTMGYPRINIGYPLGTDDDYPLITTKRAKTTFQSGVECGNAISATKGTDDC